MKMECSISFIISKIIPTFLNTSIFLLKGDEFMNYQRWITFPIKFMTLEIAYILSLANYSVIKTSDSTCKIEKED